MSFSMLTQKQKIYLGVAIVIIIFMIFYYIFTNNSDYNYEDLDELDEKTESIFQSSKETEKTKIVLHITGAVNEEGIVRIEEGARIIDQTCPIMIQRLRTIFQRNPLISMGI